MARRTVSSPHSAAWGPGWWWRRRVLYPRVPLPHVSRGRHHRCSPCCCCCWRPGGGCCRCCWRGSDNHLRQRCWGASNECAAGCLVAHSPLSIAATTGGTAASSSGQHPAAPHLNRFQSNIAYALCDETFCFIPLQYLTQLSIFCPICIVGCSDFLKMKSLPCSRRTGARQNLPIFWN